MSKFDPPFCAFLNSPIGILKLMATDNGLREIKLVQESGIDNHNKFTQYFSSNLNAYFKEEVKEFVDYFDFSDCSEFYINVWRTLCNIPYGTAISYKELAEEIGNPKAVRAVALANSKNPIPIVIPCHRVIGSDGSLTGYALGLETKRKLLLHESFLPPELF